MATRISAPASLPIARVAAFSADGVTPTKTDFERLMGQSDLLDVNYFWRGLIAAKAVARIIIRDAGGRTLGYASGFMVSPRLMLTNHHVFGDENESVNSLAEFDYERGLSGELPVSTSFGFAPDVFFFNNEILDYALVAVRPIAQDGSTPLEKYGWLRLNPVPGKVDTGEYVSIIQHPKGDPKQIAVRENQVTAIERTVIAYMTDTEPGSSGSPVFNDSWQVVALHHSAVRDPNKPGQYIANEGIRISVIVADLHANAPAREVLKTFFALGSKDKPWSFDTLTGVASQLKQTGNSGEAFGASTMVARAVDGGAVISMPVDFFISQRIPAINRAPYVRQESDIKTGAAARSADRGPEEKLVFDDDYTNRRGYDKNFLGIELPLPEFGASARANILSPADGAWLPYHHFSIATNGERCLPHVVASNVDYGPDRRLDLARKDFGTDQWKPDSRIESKYQTTGASHVYSDPGLDQGHVNRREDNCWGSSEEEVVYANSDTFHYTNCTPQHKAFNRSSLRGLWGKLENHITAQSKNYPKVSLFAGPVLSEEDTSFGTTPPTYKVPRSFWKVVAVASDDRTAIRSYSFLLDQSELIKPTDAREEFDPGEFAAYQVAIADIEALTGLIFPDVLKAGDVMGPDSKETLRSKKPIQELADVAL